MTETSEITVVPQSLPARAISLLPVEQMTPILDEYARRRTAFRDWLRSRLVEGVHFGFPPGCSQPNVDPRQWKAKPSLYKAGADFLCDMLKLEPKFTPDEITWSMLGKPAGTVVFQCTLLCRGDSPFFPDWENGKVVGGGSGAGVAGVKKRDGNGAIKIAEKCAKVGAVIHTLGISDLFTQDIEAAPPEPGQAPNANPTAPKVKPRAERDDTDPNAVTGEQIKALWRETGIATQAEFAAWAKKVLSSDLTMGCVAHWNADAIDYCRQKLQEQS